MARQANEIRHRMFTLIVANYMYIQKKADAVQGPAKFGRIIYLDPFPPSSHAQTIWIFLQRQPYYYTVQNSKLPLR